MKKMWLLLLLWFPIVITAQTKKFTIEGKIGTWDSPATISLNYRINDKSVTINSAVSKGKFTFQGQINYPVKGYLSLFYRGPGKMGSAYPLWIEPGHIKINSPDSLQKITITGSVLNAEDAALSVVRKEITQEMIKWLAVNGTPENNDSEEYKIKYEKMVADFDEKNKIATIDFIKKHPASFLSLAELNINLSRGVPDISLVEPIFNKLAPAIKNSPMGKAYQESLKKWKKTDIGSMAIEFAQPDPNGKIIKLSDFRGKYVFLDFWASWCIPCRAENPNLIKQYNLYKDKGFTILSLSLDGDNHGTKEQWINAIEKDKIGQWTHVSDLTGYDKNEVRIKYGVGSIPESFLIGPDGIVIAKSLRGVSLNKKLKEIFSGTPTTENLSNAPASYPLLNKKLTLDTAVRIGKLPNGFTYYIRKNTQPKDRIILYLVNKVGSILENEDQRGLAHFLEHMNFNGTTHFPKNELVNYLQKSGVRFGADINAYTGFDETVYQLPLPSDKSAILDSGILIMRDWAQGATLDEEEIEKERGVILEEKRKGKGAGERLQRQILPVLFNQSRYAERLPIGTDEVLKNFKPEAIRSFYNSWYRPDLQALIVVGDGDLDAIEKAIREKFSDLKNPLNAPPRTGYTVPLTGKNQFIIATDHEQPSISIQILFKHRAAKLQTGDDYRNYIIQNLFNSMMADRTNEITANKSNPPFISGGAGIGSFIGNLDTYSLSFRAKPGEIEAGFKALWQENERIKRYGFTQTELDRAKQAFLSRQESKVAGLRTTYSQQFVTEYLEHFLKGTAQPGIATELQLTKEFIPGITLADLNFFIKQYTKDVDRDVIITAPEKERPTLPDEKKIDQWMNEVAETNITAYSDTYKEKLFFNKSVTPGKIKESKVLDKINATEWLLSNGAKVILKSTKFMADDISFSAIAPGGNSLFNDEDYPSAAYAALLLNMSGIGDLNASEMNKFLGSKKLAIGTSIGTYESGIDGGTNLKELETFMQAIHLRFSHQRVDKESFEGNIERFLASLANRGNSPEDEFSSVLLSTINNGNIRGKKEDSTFYKAIGLDKANRIYNEVFGNASHFTFVFVGEIDTTLFKPLVEKYLASLPGNSDATKPVAKNLNLYPPSGNLTKLVFRGTEQKASVNLTFSGPYNYSEVQNKTMDALKEILEIKLLERLREKESGVYSPSVLVREEKFPKPRYRFRIAFECNPDNVDKLIAATLDEINILKVKGPDEISLEKFKAEDRNKHVLDLKENQYWVNKIEQSILNQEDVNADNDYEGVLLQITKESIRSAASKYLNGDNLIRFILLPEKYKK